LLIITLNILLIVYITLFCIPTVLSIYKGLYEELTSIVTLENKFFDLILLKYEFYNWVLAPVKMEVFYVVKQVPSNLSESAFDSSL
jgi:hypothetical protein